jgi:Tfp pilus assembly protein PilE
MGQQQLLLVILVTIIVGIATVVAINTFSTAASSANIDSVVNDMASIASSAQSYYMRPTMLGGGGRTFTGIAFQDLAFPFEGLSSDSLTAQNANGRYVIAVTNSQTIQITAHPSSDGDYIAGVVDPVTKVLTGGTDATNTITGTIQPNSYSIDN